jgi:hypothetical protein
VNGDADDHLHNLTCLLIVLLIAMEKDGLQIIVQ